MNSENTPQQVFFKPEVFEVSGLEQAKSIIVTPEPGTTTVERWEKETGYLVPDIGARLAIQPAMCVLDYGCGIGRVSKGLIERFGCRVIGIDSSRAMRLLAPEYVLSDRFLIWSPETLDKMVATGYRLDAAICLWVVQHVLEPAKVIRQIAGTLKPGKLLYALNQRTRCVPTNRGWVNDGFDVCLGLREVFEEQSFHSLPESATTSQLAAMSMIQILRSRET